MRKDSGFSVSKDTHGDAGYGEGEHSVVLDRSRDRVDMTPSPKVFFSFYEAPTF